MKIVIAMKVRGQWTQAELTFKDAQVLLRHDTAFDEIMTIDNGKLIRILKQSAEPSPEVHPDNPEVPQSIPQ